jgi:hypothetical protein
MAIPSEWRVSIEREFTGAVYVALYEIADDGQMSFVDNAVFDATQTASEVAQWLTKHWAPRARFPLR